jgi:CheY-like chemotaxis protein
MFDKNLFLLVEDSQDDVLLIRRAFTKAKIHDALQVVRNGEEALAYLKGEGHYSNRTEYPLPDLVLLDLKLPGKDGFEVLQWIRHEPGFSALRVVVLTSTDDIRDVNRAYQLGANSFVVKPVDGSDFVSIVQALQGFWLWMSKSPEVFRSLTQTGPNVEAFW